MIIEEEDYLEHYGILRRSGRYPWGSGGTENVRNKSFLQTYDEFKKQGFSDVDFCTAFGIGTTDKSGTFRPSTTQLRAVKSIAKNQQKQADIAMAQKLKDKGYSNVAIGQRMGKPESSVRALLAPGVKDKADILLSTSQMLKRQVDEKGFIDVGVGVENYVGVSKEKLNTAVSMLREQGYVTHNVPVRQLGTGKDTQVKVLAGPGTTWGDVRRNQDNIQQIREFSDDGGHNFTGIKKPIAVDPNRVDVVYAADGGDKADGVIYVRPGVEDLSLGGKGYGQVRIQVGPGHYLKGMAVYKDGLPNGVDLQFNTNKDSTGNKLDAMKPLERNAAGKVDKDLPFGSVVRQITDKPGPTGKVTSAMNLVNEEGDWHNWSRTLSSQMLSKQSPTLAKEQLDLTFERRKQELTDIKSLTNPTVKKKLLEGFADGTDSAAVHLKAAALPRQASQVILPINSLKPNEIYAPNFQPGERVVLVRYPHGGTFEIPELTVNNRNAEGRKIIGPNARDAVGIHHSVAEHLSGADFDGDTVLVIPNRAGKVKYSPALENLKNFNPKTAYPGYPGMQRMKPGQKQPEMGKISNLITDMTIKGASHEKIARAVKHSMVVIDAEKHGLDYRRSAIENGIKQLKEEYQGKSTGGASTLISLKKSEARINERKARPQSQGGPIDRITGAKVFVETGRTGASGQPRLTKVSKLALTEDAHSLSSGTRIEKLYADHSNRLKSLANEARLEMLSTPPLKYSASAKKTYAPEVETLNARLTLALNNAPRERQAQIVANAIVRAKRNDNPNMEPETRKKIEYQALEDARARMGAGKDVIKITPREWDAIQAGAISNNKLEQILAHSDLDVLRTLATPRHKRVMTVTAVSRAKSMLDAGYTRAEVASQLGVSTSTLDEAVHGTGT